MATVALCWAAALAPSSTVADELFALLKSMWQAQQFSEVLPLLEAYRQQQPFGRSVVVDYMLATASCQVPGREFDGQRYFAWVVYRYQLSAEQRERVLADWRRCGIQTSAVGDPSEVKPEPLATATVVGGLKLYYLLEHAGTPLETKAIGTERVQIVRPLEPEELAARQFYPGDEALAPSVVASLAGPDFTAVAADRFIVAAPTHRRGELPAVVSGLTHALRFFSQEYDVELPEQLISVYLADYQDLPRLAERLHGLELPAASIGYSIRDDLSVIGNSLGTLQHELFHLVVRRDFGDIPPWLDEGVAALYEVTVRDGERVRGVANWRGPVLEELWSLRPTIGELLGMDWLTFDVREHSSLDIERQAANHATARYFTLYLQDRGLLTEVFKAVRAQEPLTTVDPVGDTIKAVEAIVGSPVEEIEADFATWFHG